MLNDSVVQIINEGAGFGNEEHLSQFRQHWNTRETYYGSILSALPAAERAQAKAELDDIRERLTSVVQGRD